MLIQVLCNRYDLVESYIGDDDIQFILLQNGVYLMPTLLACMPLKQIKVLESDWLASGLGQQLSVADEQLVSAAQWVALCAEHNNVVTIQ